MITSVTPRDAENVERALATGAVRWAGGIFLALHGLLHWGVASAAQRPGAFRMPSLWGPDYTSAVLDGIGLGNASQVVGGTLWLVAAIAFVLAALSVTRILLPEGLARPLVVVGAVASIVVFWLFWTPALEAGAAISVGVGLVSVAWPVAARYVRSSRHLPGIAARS